MSTCAFEGCSLTAVGNKGLCARHMAVSQPRTKPVSHEPVIERPVETAAMLEEDENKFAPATDATDTDAEEIEVAPQPMPRKPRVRSQAEEGANEPDPIAVGARIAEMIVAQQRQEANRKMKRKQVPRDPETGERLPTDEPPRVPLKLYSKRKRRDSTAIVHPETGENLVKKGWIGRWVRQVDHRDRPTEQRQVEMEDYGYEVITVDGKPFTSNLGVAMQAPPEQYALRCVEKSVPGAIHGQEKLMEDAQQAVESLNSMVGEEVARFYQDREHGKETSQERVYRRGS